MRKNKYRFPDNKDINYKLNDSIGTSTDNRACTLKISMCDDKYPMYDLNTDEIKLFVKFAKKVENMEWRDIKKDKGLRYETLDGIEKPSNISNDVLIRSMRLSKKFRILGYRQNEFFYIVWFDNNHETC